MKRAKSVDEFIANADHWTSELRKLRQVLKATELDEGVKWGAPCYMLDGKNIVGIGAFKSYFGLWFFQGGLLADKKNVLINAQEGKTQTMRQWRMHAASDIKPAIVKSYVRESIKQSKAGKAIKANRSKPVVVPPELKRAFGNNKKAATNFKDMRLGMRREYADYVADAKREDTKLRRIDRILPMISAGVGLHDKYR